MKAREALIAWTPNEPAYPAEYRGRVRVAPLALGGGSLLKPVYSRTGGAAFVATRHMKGDQSALRLFIEFHTLVVRDGIDPQAAHEAFLAVDEYRDLISPDCPTPAKEL
jgi:hypothetical protein